MIKKLAILAATLIVGYSQNSVTNTLTPYNKLAWTDPNPIGSIKNYNLYIGTNTLAHAFDPSLGSTQYINGSTLGNLLPPGTKTVFITAVSTNGIESDPSAPFVFNVDTNKFLAPMSVQIINEFILKATNIIWIP